MVMAEKQTHRSLEWNRRAQLSNHTYMDRYFSTEEPEMHVGIKIVFSVNGAWKTGKLHAKE